MLTRRLLQLLFGLALYGVSLAMVIRASLGTAPWDVFHQGLAGRTGLSLGTVVIIVSFLVLLLWIPLRQMPGLGTIANVIWIGLSADVALAFIPEVHGLPAQLALFAVSRACCSAGISIAASIAMIAITTRSSMRVKRSFSLVCSLFFRMFV